jgi:hypothetical protein
VANKCLPRPQLKLEPNRQLVERPSQRQVSKYLLRLLARLELPKPPGLPLRPGMPLLLNKEDNKEMLW